LARQISADPNNGDLIQYYYKCRKEYKALVRKKNRTYKAKTLGTLLDMEHKNPKAFWSVIDRFRNCGNAGKEQANNIDPDIWRDHFKGLLSPATNPVSSMQQQGTSSQNYSRELDKPITMREIFKAIKTLKNNTSCGSDGIKNEMIKGCTCNSNMINCICKLFNMILTTGKFPTSWRDSTIIPIFKNGNPTDPNNYRGIAISSCLSKLFARVLNDRLEGVCNNHHIISDCQIGFRRGFRTTDHIYLIKSVIDKVVKKGKYLYVCFVDFSKAYDRIWREALFTNSSVWA